MNHTRTHKTVRSLLVWLLLLTMVFGLLPMAAFADETVVEPVVTEELEQETEPSSEPTPSEPTQEPTQEPEEDPMDEPSEEELIDEVDVLAVDETVVIDESSIADPDVPGLPSAGDNSIRAVMLDCGRKYFTVAQIERLIDTMVQYKYNQLQLSFGNGGCRFLLNDMSLNFRDGSGNTVTMKSDDVKANITAGNNSFNGDTSFLSESDMDTIINYANGKVSIVPMLNMPGHAAAIVNNTEYSTNGNLNVNELKARNYGYALLSKYVDYFKGKGCTYFSFGADESGFTGTGMNSFINGCAKIIANAGMRPRAFNDATNAEGVTFPTYVQISYWHKESASKSASDLANAGYEMLNTHGRWYYVIKTAQNSENGTKYWQGTANTAATSVELPVMKATKMDKKWVGLNEYFDNNPGSGSTVSNSKGTMFCIWCDASQNEYLTGEQVISDNEQYGALYQLQALAEHYWGNEIGTGGGSTGGGSTGGDAGTVVELKVGETATFTDIDSTVAAGDKITGDDANIATAEVAASAATLSSVKQVTSITSGKKYLIASQDDYVVTNDSTSSTAFGGTAYGLKIDNSLVVNDANVTKLTPYLWTITESGNNYTVVDKDGKYLAINANSNVGLSDTQVTLNIGTYTATNTFSFFDSSSRYLDNFGGSGHTYYNTLASAWYTTSPADNNKWKLYEIVEETAGGNTLTITGTGEGNTSVTVGTVTYNITVTAPKTTETKALSYGNSFTLPTGATAEITSGSGVTIENGKVIAGNADATAVVTAVVTNAGGKVTAQYVYNVTVTEINFDNVADLPVQLWITNTWVGADSAPSSLQTVNISAREAYSEEGVLLGSKVPATGYKKDSSNTVRVTYWKGAVLHDGAVPVQQGTDYSNSGDTFVRVRYWDNSWQYQLNGQWVNIDLSTNKDTVIAYYLQINNVSPEITTGTQHYGNPPTAHPGATSGNGYNMTAFAVVYPDGTLSRTEQQMYETGMIRGFWGGTSCNIGTIYAENNSTYKVSKITVTWGANKLGSSGDNWYTENKTGTYGEAWGVDWEKTTNSAGDEWYKETTYWKDGDSEIPMIDGEKEGLNLTPTKNAVLILIYLEVVETKNTLNIIYWDDNGNKQITTNPMPIPVVVAPNTTFINNGIQQKSAVNKGTFTLDDDAYILNSSGVPQGFNKNLSTVPGVTGVYLSGMYQYASADISDDEMTLTLHFNLKSATMEKTYVVDFGLPLEVPATEFNISNVNTIQKMSLEKNAETMQAQGNYGRATIAVDFSKVTYELNKMLNGKATIPLYVTFNGGTTLEYRVNIIPATNVYYEDSFVGNGFKNGTGAAASAVWKLDGKEETAKQALSELGSKNIYGNDGAYNNSSKFSMGSAKTVTVESGMLNGWDDTSAWPTATFTFKGTGFDIISLTNNKSGSIFVDVYAGAKAEGNRIKSYIVNNYYGYTYENGDWVVKQGEGDTLYQIPVMKIRDLDYGEYTAVVTVFYDGAFNSTGTEKCSFWFDGFRVYDPMGKNVSDYTMDKEGYPQYIKLRTEIINKNETNKGNATALFIDGAKEATVEQYKNFGPNNEVYLGNGQAISFKLPANTNIATVQIGAKSPNASDTVKPTMSVKINDTTLDPKEIGTATEMYYKISESGADAQQVTITNTGKAILSLTNIKITYSEKSTTELAALSEGDEQAAVAAVRALYAAPVVEPVEPFKPGRFETSWSSNVRKGSRAVLTVKASTDVDAIVVNGVTVTQFKTRTERIGYGWNAKRVTYREFSYMMTANEVGTINIPVVAVSNDLGSSAAYDSTLTVKPSSPIRDWIGGIFGRWF